MARGRGGEGEAAFSAVFEVERDAVLRLACALVGDVEVARDLAADAFARTYAQWRRGRVEQPGAYVRQAVVNGARDHFRRAQRRRRHEARRTGDDRGAGSVADGVVGRDAVQRLLTELPVRQRAALVLRYWVDCTDVQVAEALGVPVGTAKSLLRRGLARMREAVASSGAAHDTRAGEESRRTGQERA